MQDVCILDIGSEIILYNASNNLWQAGMLESGVWMVWTQPNVFRHCAIISSGQKCENWMF
jgi:hypothetical protein